MAEEGGCGEKKKKWKNGVKRIKHGKRKKKFIERKRERKKNINRTDVLLSNSANDRVSSSYLNHFWFTMKNYWLSWLVQKQNWFYFFYTRHR